MSNDRENLRRSAKLAIELGHECLTRGYEHCKRCAFNPSPQEILDILAERDTYRKMASSRATLVREKRRLILAQRERIAKLEAERGVVREDVRLAAGELLVDMAEAAPGTTVARLLIANRIMRRERDELREQISNLEA